MKDKEKFIGFKENIIKKNEEDYGEELRGKYGDVVIDNSNMKIRNMDEIKYEEAQNLSNQLNSMLKEAYIIGDAGGDLAQKCCSLHKEWLLYFWESSYYSKEAHLGLVQMYVDDKRFKKHYDKIFPGCAEFLLKSLTIYLK